MAEEAVLTEEEQVAAEAKATEEKAAEEKAAEEAAAKEKSPLDQREEEIRLQEEAAIKEEKEDKDTDVEDLDWDKLKEEHPEIEKLGIKDVAELIKRYFGGLPDFQKNAEIVKELKKLGIETPSEREELFKKLATKEEIKPPEKTPGEKDTGPKNFAERRTRDLSEHIAKSSMYHTTDEETGERVPLSEDAQKATAQHLSEFAESIVPSKLIDGLMASAARAQQLEEDVLWDKYAASCGDDAPSDEVREEIQKHAEEYPHVYRDIIDKARGKKQNWWKPCHRYFILNTKAEDIDGAKSKRAQEEREKEAKKKADAKTETVKKAVPTGASKSLKDMTFAEREQAIRDMEKAG